MLAMLALIVTLANAAMISWPLFAVEAAVAAVVVMLLSCFGEEA